MGNTSWLWENWRGLWPVPWLNLVLALVALLCGLIVGIERQSREKPAGLRTLTMVCLGSAVFTMLSFSFTSTTGDSGRVAAQIVTGIGFLGAGVILHGRRTVSGMTTAAIIWVTAAIGMAVGAGFVVGGLALSFLVNLLLRGVFLYETRWHPDLRQICVVINFIPKGGLTRIRIERILVDYNLNGPASDWIVQTDDNYRLTLRMNLPQIHLYELLAELADVPDIISIEQESCPVAKKTSS